MFACSLALWLFCITLRNINRNEENMGTLNFQELISAFIVLFAVIDIIGAVPIILDLKQKGRAVNAVQATLIAAALLLGFFLPVI